MARSCRRGHRRSVTAGTACLAEAGQATWRRRARPQGSRPKGATRPPPRSRTAAPPIPAEALAVVPVSVTHSLSMTSRPCLCPGTGPDGGVPEARP